MNIYDNIQKKVYQWHSQHPEGIESFVDNIIRESNNETVQKLNDFVDYLTMYGLKDHLPNAYIDAKYHLKEKAIENLDASPDDKTKAALYDWLKICINTQKDINYDFYFEKNNLNREEEVKTILFGNGKLRKIFKNRDWQIRLKTVADWFLRRYNGEIARDILRSHQNFDCWDNLKLFYPRMIVAIIVGLLALMTGQEIWDLPHNISGRITGVIYGPIAKFWGWHLSDAYSNLVSLIGLLVIVFFFYVLSVLYLRYECYNIIFDTKAAGCRARKVGGRGLFASLILSTLICYAIGPISGTKEVMNPATYYSCQAGLPVFKNIIFFASAALFIGIFMQVFWEKETITEPL